MGAVKAKKHLGQHFLNDLSIAKRIVDSLTADGIQKVLEVGPGMGVLTQFLLQRTDIETSVVEIDTESVEYLKANYPSLTPRIYEHDFLRYDFSNEFPDQYAVIGNFPYNISSQIFFKVYENKDKIPEVVGMLQKEVAERIASKPGSKVYGILSVLLQAYYDIDYLFTVGENVFTPPPKVKSGVIRLVRNNKEKLNCNEKLFKQVVKMGFNQRRKTLRNSLKQLLKDHKIDNPIMGKRPEQLSVSQFIDLTNMIDEIVKRE